MKIRINDDIHNKAYLPYLDDVRKYQIYYGGAGSGKSDFVGSKILIHFMQWKGWNGMICRHTGADNHTSTFSLFCQLINRWGLQDLFFINKSKGSETITFKGNSNMMVFKGLDDVEKRKGITFPNGVLHFVWVEELTETTEHNFNQLDIRMRGQSKLPKIMFGSFNPIDASHWVKARFFDRPIPKEDGFTLKTTYKDNEFLTEQDRRTLESYKEKDEYYYQVYALGEWGNISNAKVFSNVSIIDFEYAERDLENVRYGLDFGFVHATALMGSGYKDGTLYIFDEHYYKELTNQQVIEQVENAGFSKNYLITADSAEPDRIQEWRNYGFNMTAAKKGPNSLRDGIAYLQNLPSIVIHASKCPNAAREFLKFKRRQLKDGSISEQFVEIDDDTIAAVRYGNEDIWGNKIELIWSR